MGMRGGKATIELHTEVVGTLRRGCRAWVPAGPEYPAERDWIYKATELERALYVYSVTVSRFLPVQVGGFRLVARSLTVGGTVGIHEWRVSDETGRWVPTGAPWVIWDEVVQLAA